MPSSISFTSKGIFISPASILRHTGSMGLSLCVWAVGALIAACGALVYVELGKCHPPLFPSIFLLLFAHFRHNNPQIRRRFCLFVPCQMVGPFGSAARPSHCPLLPHSLPRYPLAAAFLWVSTTLTFPTIMAIQTLTFGEYVFEGLNPFFAISPESMDLLKRLIGYLAIWMICFINLFSLASRLFCLNFIFNLFVN